MTEDRVFRDKMIFEIWAEVDASAEKNGLSRPGIIERDRISHEGRPYVIRSLGVIDDAGNVVQVAKSNGSGVRWVPNTEGWRATRGENDGSGRNVEEDLPGAAAGEPGGL